MSAPASSPLAPVPANAGPERLPTQAEIASALRAVQDPELNLSLVDLGLIYGVQFDANGAVSVQMTLTSPACPVGSLLQTQVHAAVLRLPGVREVHVELVWNPPWDLHTMASDELKMELGLI